MKFYNLTLLLLLAALARAEFGEVGGTDNDNGGDNDDGGDTSGLRLGVIDPELMKLAASATPDGTVTTMSEEESGPSAATISVSSRCWCGVWPGNRVQKRSANISESITGGRDSHIYYHPWQVQLRYNNRFFCGGSIISDRYILTAAHCVDWIRSTSLLTVVAGNTYLSNTGGERYGVEQIRRHASFNRNYLTRGYDIAIIRVNRVITFRYGISPICMPTSRLIDAHVLTAYSRLAGWGKTSSTSGVSYRLKDTRLITHTNAWCNRNTIWRTYSNVFCAQYSSNSGACNGDSGGPISTIACGSRYWYVSGVVSFGSSSCPNTRTVPTYFINVAYFRNLLYANMFNTRFCRNYYDEV